MTTAKLTAATIALLAAVTTTADAGPGCKNRIHPPAPTVVTYPPVTTHPPITNDWYFGMSIQLRHTSYGQGLEVYSVSPYSPAAHVGLEPGDIILSANGVNFNYARTNQSGVQLLQRSVSTHGGGLPVPTGPVPTATAATAFAQPVTTQVSTGGGVQGSVQLQVLDSRTVRVVSLTVFPQYRGHSGGLPAPTATFAR